jgi:hypothetical protein
MGQMKRIHDLRCHLEEEAEATHEPLDDIIERICGRLHVKFNNREGSNADAILLMQLVQLKQIRRTMSVPR